MKSIYQLSIIIVAFMFGLSTSVYATATPPQAKVADADADGVEDGSDLCPNTPSNVKVNQHGCAIELANCDYSTSSITFGTISTPPAGKETRFLLVDSKTTNIAQVSTSTTFTGIIGSKTYMIVAFSYENDGTVSGLVVGQPLSQVKAACADFSQALSLRICSPFVESSQCDFSTPNITLKLSSPAQAGVITKYLLINSSSGIIIQLNNAPSFSNLEGNQSFNAFAVSYSDDNSITNLAVGKKIDDISANCLDWSNPLAIKVCACKPDICLPITIVKTKNN
jgi:hypothetical protein